jgi:hypothetical protein
LAWLWFALVNIDFTIVPQKTGRALACVAVEINWVLDTFSPPSFCLLIVLAWVGPATRRKAERDIVVPPSTQSNAMKTGTAFIITGVKTLMKWLCTGSVSSGVRSIGEDSVLGERCMGVVVVELVLS